MKTESIAQQLKDDFADWRSFFEAAKSQSVTADQNWDNGETVFAFKDGSELTVTDEIEVTK